MAGFERFELNYAGVREYMLSGALYPALERPALAISGRAKALGSQHVRTGDYDRGIQGPSRERHHDRVVVRVYATDAKSALLESRYHVMGRAIG
jgi:hypothetical protein